VTTKTEISELKDEMDAKFDKVFDELAELKMDMNGFREDVNARFEAQDARFDSMESKLDLLLKAHGIDPSAQVG